MANGIFTEQAMEKVSSPERLDQHVRITKPSAWVLLLAITSIVIGGGVWAIKGNMSDSVDSRGIIFPSKGVSVMYAQAPGIITDILVKEGSNVVKGDILAVMPDVTTLIDIQTVMKANQMITDPTAIQQNNNTIDSLRYRYLANSMIIAQEAGVVQNVAALKESLDTGSPLVTNIGNDIESNTKEILCYVPYGTGDINVGMTVQASPLSSPREEFGYMTGVVTSVGKTPVDAASITKTLGTQQYAQALGLSESSSVVEVRVRLNIASTSQSNEFEWSNEKGRELTVGVGTVCNVKIITKDKKPIELLK